MDKGYLYIREVFSSEVVQRYLEGSPVRTSVSLYICIAPVVSSGRVMAVTVGRSLRASVSSLWPMVFGDGFRVCEAEAEIGHKCHRGQARRARQEPDALRLEREIRVFPALAQQSLSRSSPPPTSVRWRVCGICGEERMRNGINHTVSPVLAAPRCELTR